MKKIIILCNHFAPDNTIAAVRLTKIAKYLYQQDYQVTVIAEKKYNEAIDEILQKDAEGITVFRVENSALINKIVLLYKRLINPLKEKKYNNLNNRMKINPKTGKQEFYPFETAYPFLGSMDYLVELLRQYDLCRMAKVILRQHLNTNYIFTSYGDFFGLFAGKYLHKKTKKIPWIFDIRDAICRYKFTPQYVWWIAKIYENYIWHEAKVITAVSKGICSHIPAQYQKKTFCVTNGYDKNDRDGIQKEKKQDKIMRFVYTGAMYGGLQNLSPLFRNIERLLNENQMDIDKIEFLFAGKESAFEIFKSQAQRYGLDSKCIYYGKITRKEALKLQMKADVLLVSSFDYQTEVSGVITGKALEYMSADKPIIAIINGDIITSELAEIIRSANLGCAYEEAHHQRDSEELYQYLKKKYQELQQIGRVIHKPDKNKLEKFEYWFIAQKMMKIIEKMTREEIVS